MHSIGRKLVIMTTLDWAAAIRTSEVKVYGPRFTDEGADGSFFEKAIPIGVVDVSKYYSTHIGVVVATPEGPQVWIAEKHFCRSHVGRVLLLEDSLPASSYLNGEVITWGENLSWNLHKDEEEEEEEKESDEITLDL